MNFEASDKIDDLVIETTSGRKVYMQMKRNISFSEEKDSEFYGVCKQFVKQFCQRDLNDVAYILATRTQASSRITIKLKRILDGIRLANSIEIKDNLNKEEIDILDKFESNIKIIYEENIGKQINDKTLKEILCKIYIEALDIEDGESFEKNVKLILYSKLSMISMAAKYAANRRRLERSYLHEKIKEYIVSFESGEGNGKLLKSIWDLNKANIMVQKDYVVAFQTDNLEKKMKRSKS